MRFLKEIILFVLFLLFISVRGNAQMERQRANVTEPVETFWTPTLISQTTTETLQARNLNSTIMHSFGIATTNAIQNFFGLDNIQNVRLGLDYGITDQWAVGIGRSSRFNVVDIRTKYAIMQQTTDNSKPLSVALKGDLGIITQENRQPFKDDVSILLSAIVSKKFNQTLSLQLSPMYGYYSSVGAGQENHLFSLGVGSRITLSERYSLIAEYYPVIGKRNSDTNNAFSLGLNIQTGGHVFQLFFASTRWHLEQYVIANNREQFWAGDFRFGFNVNRIFGL
ncbi:DUF5777 family beta-barrel protein [Fodinibius halophilus]|uniref:DUF5777 domain-containing protein n=1 Tax=Fodinibius halophilus TaxID=1736908 RepID=A0A6M1T7C4_9BACT|nr:DUF5777 family beta-barrel protein [Fodinibius halophilus]NGP87891.1 hypothetical protein [Fodinibius halophilus]